MGTVIAEVVPLAMGIVLVNPLPVMLIILLLFSPGAKATGPAFVVGWVIGLAVVVSLLLILLTPEHLAGSERDPSTLASVVRLVLGLVLLWLAAQRWRGRPGPGEEKALPAWTTRLERASPLMALGMGALLSGVNPKNLAFTVSASVAIAQAELPAGRNAVIVAIFVLLASVGVAVPVIWYAIAPESASRTLAGWRAWLTANYATLMAIVFLVFGVILSAKGLGDLFG